MDQAGRTSAAQIETHIQDERTDLWSNLQELERKVKSVTDWQRHFQKNPLMLLGVALGGGIFLAILAGRRSPGEGHVYPAVASPSRSTYRSARPSAAKDKTLETWDNIKMAAIAVAAVRLKEYAEGILPGFSAQYDKVAEGHSRTASV